MAFLVKGIAKEIGKAVKEVKEAVQESKSSNGVFTAMDKLGYFVNQLGRMEEFAFNIIDSLSTEQATEAEATESLSKIIDFGRATLDYLQSIIHDGLKLTSPAYTIKKTKVSEREWEYSVPEHTHSISTDGHKDGAGVYLCPFKCGFTFTGSGEPSLRFHLMSEHSIKSRKKLEELMPK